MLVHDSRPTHDGRLDAATGQAVADLTRAFLALRPLALAGDALDVPDLDPVPPLPGHLATPEVVRLVANRLGVALHDPRGCAGRPECGCGERPGAVVAAIVADRLGPAVSAPALTRIPDTAGDDVLRLVDAVAADAFDSWRSPTDAISADGVALRTYAAGRRDRPAIVLASACGMPAQLCEPWMRLLCADYHVVTWETRGLFGDLGDPTTFDRMDHDVAAQASDLLAVLDHHGVTDAHVMGLCGGAVLALAAAAAHPDRISSLSLWHGDFSGSACPTTEHQDNLKALMEMALTGRDDAAAINAALMGTALAAVPADVAHLVIYPYLNGELFYRYCALTSPTMSTSTAGMLAGLSQPCLVVTSEDDHTAHPAGSHHVAAALPGAVLRVEPHGDHISVFGAGARLARVLADFLAETGHQNV